MKCRKPIEISLPYNTSCEAANAITLSFGFTRFCRLWFLRLESQITDCYRMVFPRSRMNDVCKFIWPHKLPEYEPLATCLLGISRRPGEFVRAGYRIHTRALRIKTRRANIVLPMCGIWSQLMGVGSIHWLRRLLISFCAHGMTLQSPVFRKTVAR